MKKSRVLLLSIFTFSAAVTLAVRAHNAHASGALFCAQKCEQVERSCRANGGDPSTCDATYNACQDACLGR